MMKLAPIHPGEVLREEFLRPLGLSAGAVARAVAVPRTRIERLAAEEVDLTPDTALRLARYFGTTPEFWMNIQGRYALETAADALGSELDQVQPLKVPFPRCP
jgi:addiction module HigA family antidote